MAILLLIGLHESDCFASEDRATICKNECTYYRDRDVYFDPSGLIKKCLEQCFNSHCIDPCMAQKFEGFFKQRRVEMSRFQSSNILIILIFRLIILPLNHYHSLAICLLHMSYFCSISFRSSFTLILHVKVKLYTSTLKVE